jgi:hypothetical protein
MNGGYGFLNIYTHNTCARSHTRKILQSFKIAEICYGKTPYDDYTLSEQERDIIRVKNLPRLVELGHTLSQRDIELLNKYGFLIVDIIKQT